MVAEGLRRTGYDEVALTSLSTADFSGIERRRRPTSSTTRSTCGQVSVSLPSACGSTPSPSASPPRSRRPGAPGSPSPPRPARGGMRQVINKLIREDDLYGAVDSAYSQGWRRMKLYFLTGLPTETDEDTLGIAELARNCVEIGKRHTEPGVGHRVGRRVRAQAVHAVPVVRAEHRRRAAAQGRPAARRHLRKARGVQLKWHDPKATAGRGHRQPRRSPARPGHRGRLARRRHVPGVVASTSTSSCWADAMAADGLSIDWYVHRHRTEDEVLPVGPPLGRAAQGLPLAGLARRARRGRPRGLPLDALLRLRRVHRLRHRARRRLGHRRRPAAARAPARTSAAAARCRSRCSAAGPSRSAGSRPMRVRLRFAKLGKVRFTSHRDVARLWERALRRAELPVALTEGFSPRPEGALRAGPVDRPRVARRVPRRRPREPDAPARRARRRCPARLTPLLPDRPRRARPPSRSTAATPSLQQAVTSCTLAASRSSAVDRRRRRRRSQPRSLAAETRGHPRAQGQARSPTTSAPPSSTSRRRSVGDRSTAPCSTPSWPPNPAACDPPSCWPPCSRRRRPRAGGCVGPTNGSTIDGARTEPIALDAAHVAGAPPRSVRHEKGTPP